jgi:hypothetical protein
VAEGDNDVEQEDQVQFVPLEPMLRDASERMLPKEELPSKVSSPKPHPLLIPFEPQIPSEKRTIVALVARCRAWEMSLVMRWMSRISSAQRISWIWA